MACGPENLYLAFKSFIIFFLLLLKLGFTHSSLKVLFFLLTPRLLSDVTQATLLYIIDPIKVCDDEHMEIILNNAGHRASVHPCIRRSSKCLLTREGVLDNSVAKDPLCLLYDNISDHFVR